MNPTLTLLRGPLRYDDARAGELILGLPSAADHQNRAPGMPASPSSRSALYSTLLCPEGVCYSRRLFMAVSP